MLWILSICLALPVAGLCMAGLPLIWAVVIVFAAFVVVALAVARKH